MAENKGIATELRGVNFIDLSKIKILVHETYINLCFRNGKSLMMNFNTIVISSI